MTVHNTAIDFDGGCITPDNFFNVKGEGDDNKPSRIYKIKLYYKDSPTPTIFNNVWHIQTEGQLLRLIINGKSQWIPLVNVAYFKEIDKRDTE